MGDSVDPVFEALDLGADPHNSGLQPLHIVNAAENLILKRKVAPIVARRIADRDNIAVDQLLRRAHRQAKHLVGRQSVHPQQSHVPVRMDHLDAAHGEVGGAVVLGRVLLSLEVDCGVAAAVLDGEAKSAGEDLRDMAVGRDQSLADHEAGSRVGKNGRIRQLDASDEGKQGGEPRLHFGAVEALQGSSTSS